MAYLPFKHQMKSEFVWKKLKNWIEHLIWAPLYLQPNILNKDYI